MQLRTETRETRHFLTTYNRGVEQGCILSPLLLNLYLGEIPRLLETVHDTDSIILPNG